MLVGDGRVSFRDGRVSFGDVRIIVSFFRLRQKSSHDPLGARPSVGAYIQRDIHQPLIPDHDAMWGPVRPGISMLFWLPLIFASALLEMATTPTGPTPNEIANASLDRRDKLSRPGGDPDFSLPAHNFRNGGPTEQVLADLGKSVFQKASGTPWR